MMEEKRREALSRYADIAALLLLPALLIICFFNAEAFTSAPWKSGFELEYPRRAAKTGDGRIYVIDRGMKRLTEVDSDRTVRCWGSGGGSFANLADMDAASDGTLYLFDADESDSESLVSKGRIIQMRDGEISELRRIDGGAERFAAISAAGGRIRLLLASRERAVLYQLRPPTAPGEAAMAPVLIGSWMFPEGDDPFNFAISPTADEFYFTTYKGSICYAKRASPVKTIFKGRTELDDLSARSGAWGVAASTDGSIIFTDSVNRAVKRLAPDGAISDITPRDEREFSRRPVYRTVIAEGGGGHFMVIGSGRALVEASGAKLVESFDGLRLKPARLALNYFVWLCALLAALLALRLAVRVAAHCMRSIKSGTLMVAAISFFSLIIIAASVVIVIPAMRSNMASLTKTNLHNLAYMSALLDIGDDIKGLRTTDAYRSPAYNRVEARLRKLLDLNRNISRSDLPIYYVLYVSDGRNIFTLMDPTGASSMLQMSPTYYPKSDTRKNLEKKIQIDYDMTSDQDGDWVFSTAPVLDSRGNAVAVLEVGSNARKLTKQIDNFVMEFFFLMVTVIATLYMFFCEAIKFIGFLRRRRAERASGLSDETTALLLRPLTFMFLMAAAMQSAFLPILAGRLFKAGGAALPASVGSAIPVSASLLAGALFGLTGGGLIERWGARRTIVTGCFVAIAGFLVIGLFQSYWTLVLGRFIFGVGQGMGLIGISTVASSFSDESTRAEAFSSYNIGNISGANIGIVIGSQLVAPLGYSAVYFIAAGVFALVIAMIFFFLPATAAARRESRPSASAGAARFLTGRGPLSFFLLIFVPYTVISYYLYFFFPIYGDANGVSEAAIGRYFLLANLIVVSTGPAATKYLLGLLGTKWAMVSASAVYAALFLVFGLAPSVAAAVALVVLLSFVDGFGFSCQNVFYTSLSAVSRYGRERSMALFSLVEKISQTCAPVVFGGAMAFGLARGLFLMGAAAAAMIPPFVLLSKGASDAEKAD